MVRTLLKPTIFDKRGKRDRDTNKIVATKTKENIEKQFIFPDIVSKKIDLNVKDFKEELIVEKSYKYLGIMVEEIVPEDKEDKVKKVK